MNEREETLEVLRQARDVVLSDASKWCQDDVVSLDGLAYCAMGAVMRAKLDLASDLNIHGLLAPLLHIQPALLAFNDDPDTTYSDVIDVFDDAVKYLEEAS